MQLDGKSIHKLLPMALNVIHIFLSTKDLAHDTLCPRAYFAPSVTGNFLPIHSNKYETSAAIIETEILTAELAQEVHNRATQAQIAAKEAALIAEVTHRPYPHPTHAPG